MVEIERKTESGLGMYTQCPDCEIAFRVTAEVLRQAAGKVRCGNCGNAFNALAYLSEQMPQQPVPKDADAALPELTPEIIETVSKGPKSISAEQSAALLKTLDELAGSDIRIEDTGVEWRVLDDDEAAAPAADDDDAAMNDGLGFDGSNVDEYLDDAATPVDEFLTATPEVVDSPEIFEDIDVVAARTSVDELRFDDNTPLPDDFDLDHESAQGLFARPEPVESEAEENEAAAAEEPAKEVALSEPDEWADILGEFEELVEEVAAPTEALADDSTTGGDDDVDADLFDAPAEDADADEPLDMDTQFALQAEAMGIDLSGITKIEDEELLDLESEGALEIDDAFALDDSDDESEEAVDEDEDETGFDEDDEVIDVDIDGELDVEIEQLDLIEEPVDLIEEPIVEAHTIEAELAGDEAEAESADSEADSDEDSGEHYVPPMSEEEHTVNLQIDQDLMALAIQDKDGFASTIVMPGKDAEKKALAEKLDEVEDEPADTEGGSLFETIIMEGEFVHSEVNSEKLAVDIAAAAELAEIARAAEAEQARQSGGSRYGIIGGVALLVIVLALQAVHQSREALATIPAFSNTIGQVYRAIGKPVQPAWDITGWRFEATKGSAEGDAEELTIYSRLGNNSDGPLPYPLIGISLTDRFEETIGSRVLDPAEYLPTDLDPRKLVEPGNTFNAIITINSAMEEATGFKLNVCYRLSGGQLRCAIDDFK